MGLETATSVAALNSNWPLGTDPRSQGDDHIRLIKSVLKADVVSKKSGGTFDSTVYVEGTDGSTAVGEFGGGSMLSSRDVYGDVRINALGIGVDVQPVAGSTYFAFFRARSSTSDTLWQVGLDGSTDQDGELRVRTGGDSCTLGLLGGGSSEFRRTNYGVTQINAGAIAVSINGPGTLSRFLRGQVDGATRVELRADGSAVNSTGSWGAISDARLKSDIEDAGPQLDDLLALRVRHYTLTETGRRMIGFIAQEVQEVKPGLVETDEDGWLGLKTTVLIPALVGAVQELAARVSALEGSA